MSAFDYEFAFRQCSGDHARTRRLLELLSARIGPDLAALQSALSASDAARAASVAHGIKGAAAALGAYPLRDVAARAEAGAREGRLADVRAALPDLDETATEFTRQVEAMISDAERPR